ncbi:hypothetical protein EK904_015074 [Melospiza melodia maxima]|nr:hypothetical protein EK904_015074 [Melospiza melodia maxima]
MFVASVAVVGSQACFGPSQIPWGVTVRALPMQEAQVQLRSLALCESSLLPAGLGKGDGIGLFGYGPRFYEEKQEKRNKCSVVPQVPLTLGWLGQPQEQPTEHGWRGVQLKITAVMDGFPGFLQPAAVHIQQSLRMSDHASKATAEIQAYLQLPEHNTHSIQQIFLAQNEQTTCKELSRHDLWTICLSVFAEVLLREG